MKTQRLFVVVLVWFAVATAGTSHAWIQFLDGSTLPEGPWQVFDDPPGSGEGTIVDFTDPDTGRPNQAIRVNSNEGAFEYYMGPFVSDEGGGEVVMGARFRLVAFSPTGKENLLCATTLSDPAAPAPSITLVDGRFKLWSYVDSDREIQDIAPADTNIFHTVYLYARKDGHVTLFWDGAILFDGDAPLVNTFNGYAEWGSGSWQFDATDIVDFDWVGYGNASDLPQQLNIARVGADLILSWSTNAVDFVLESTPSLVSAGWAPANLPVGTTGDRNTVTVVATSALRYFRLRKN
jgi:hypothetical protein